MSDPFANVCRKVTYHKEGFMNSVLDTKRMMADQYAAEAAKKINEHNDKVMEAFNQKQNQIAIEEGCNRIPLLQNAQNVALNRVVKEAPDMLLSEAFGYIYTQCLPHNKSYVLENYKNFSKMAEMYMRKLGGFKAFKRIAENTQSPFLLDMTRYISEASKSLIKDRTKKALNCLTEKQVQEIIQPTPTDEEREKLIQKIDTLGVDELADLVNHKVLKVVNDERVREKDEVEFKTILKNDLSDPSLTVDGDAGDAENLDDKTDIEEDDETRDDENRGKAKLDKKKNVKEAFSLEATLAKWDPVHFNFGYTPANEQQTLFKAMLTNITKGMILESVDPHHKRADASRVINNPLNLNIFFEFMKADRPVSDFPYAEPEQEHVTESTEPVIGTSVPSIDKNRIYSEALTQYTLLELAHTMRLIDVNMVTVAEQSKFLLNEF